MLGNDVVDLLDVDARPETFRRRFEERVFAAEERRAVAQAADSNALRWAHWGAKEAAYKLIRQCDPRFVFSPSKLVARFEPIGPGAGGQLERRGRLELGSRPELGSGPPAASSSIELCSFETRDYVHVVAVPAGSEWAAVALAVESIEGRAEDPSLAVRRLALRELGRELGVAPERLSIGRRDRIPTVELDGRATQHSLSLSHHGRFVACAMAPRGREVRFAGREGGEERERGGRGERVERSELRGRRAGSVRGANVWQATGSVGYPVRAADTVWMVG